MAVETGNITTDGSPRGYGGQRRHLDYKGVGVATSDVLPLSGAVVSHGCLGLPSLCPSEATRAGPSQLLRATSAIRSRQVQVPWQAPFSRTEALPNTMGHRQPGHNHSACGTQMVYEYAWFVCAWTLSEEEGVSDRAATPQSLVCISSPNDRRRATSKDSRPYALIKCKSIYVALCMAQGLSRKAWRL